MLSPFESYKQEATGLAKRRHEKFVEFSKVILLEVNFSKLYIL